MHAGLSEVLERLASVHQPVTRIICGVGAVEPIGSYAREYGRSVLLVTDPGLIAAGHAARVDKLLAAAGCKVARFDQVKENPTTDCVAACLEIARSSEIEVFVALGGGSAMDTAKGCNMLLTNGRRVADYCGVGKVPGPMLPLIAIPTTAGTGSEMQSAALIADAVSHQKMACLDPKALARIAILDPALTLSLPPRVTSSTGIDTIAHALESFVTRSRNPVSNAYAREAFNLAFRALPQVLAQPGNLKARERMLLAAALAGTAIEKSMLGAAHAAANPLTAHYNVIHGQAVGLMLPQVVRFNAQQNETAALYAELAVEQRFCPATESPAGAVAALVDRLEWLLNLADFPCSLCKTGVNPNAIPMLAAEAARQWTGRFNPRSVTESDFAELYQSACAVRGRGLPA